MKLLPAALLLSLLASPVYSQLATPNAAGLTYGHIHLNVADMDEYKRILTEHFNGVVVQKGFLTAVRFPNFLIALTEREPTMGSRETKMDHFGFKVRHMASFLEKLEADGLPITDGFTGSEGQNNAYVTLPGGVAVELQEDQGLHEEITGYHIHFRTEGHEELLDWYTDIFGLEVRPRGSIQTTTNAPGMNLSFGVADGSRQPTRGAAIDHIGFEFDDLEAFCKELEAKGVNFDVTFREIPEIELKIAFITDPSGVFIELTEGYDNY